MYKRLCLYVQLILKRVKILSFPVLRRVVNFYDILKQCIDVLFFLLFKACFYLFSIVNYDVGLLVLPNCFFLGHFDGAKIGSQPKRCSE